jgi:hypothetical protein
MRTCSLTRGLTAIALLVGLAGGSPALAGNPAAPGSEVIWLLKDCLAAGHDVDLDCSQQVVDITERIWGPEGLHPTAATPLIVEIGPGDFDGTLICPSGAVTSPSEAWDASTLA